jgi:hypothetical protein
MIPDTIDPSRPLPDAEWKLATALGGLAPGERSVFINYEYGRSYRPLVEDVLWIRRTAPPVREAGTQPDARPGLAAARFWARYFPEFPEIPYSEVDKVERRRRLDALGLDSLSDPYHEAAVLSHDPDIFCSQVGAGDLVMEPNLGRRFMILELRPRRSKKLLRQQVSITLIGSCTPWIRLRGNSRWAPTRVGIPEGGTTYGWLRLL